MSEAFQKKVLETADHIVAGLGNDAIIIKPILSAAKPVLRRTVEKEPEKVYAWLKTASEKIEEAMLLYENDQMQVREQSADSKE